MNNMNQVHHNEPAQPEKENNSFMLWLAAALLIFLVCGGLYYAMSGTGKQNTSITHMMTGPSTAAPPSDGPQAPK